MGGRKEGRGRGGGERVLGVHGLGLGKEDLWRYPVRKDDVWYEMT